MTEFEFIRKFVRDNVDAPGEGGALARKLARDVPEFAEGIPAHKIPPPAPTPESVSCVRREGTAPDGWSPGPFPASAWGWIAAFFAWTTGMFWLGYLLGTGR